MQEQSGYMGAAIYLHFAKPQINFKHMKIHIIGGGIIGLCTAYYLTEAGAEVEIIDKGELLDGCSFGNAGMIVPSHFVPLAAPGVIAKGIKWLFDSKSPFYIKPRLNLELLQWLWQFYKSCTPQKVAVAVPHLKELNEFSKGLYRELHQQFQFSFEEKGLLMLYQSKKAEKEEAAVAEKAHELGLEAQILDASAAQALEKQTKLNVRGAVYYPGDAHLYPNALMYNLQQYLLAKGVRIHNKTSVLDFDIQNKHIAALHTSAGRRIPTDRVVLAAGSWSAKLAGKLGLRLLLQDGKGYSVTIDRADNSPGIPAILTEAKVALTPMDQFLRVGGTLEISNFNPTVNRNRLSGIVEAVPRYYPDVAMEASANRPVWHGFRPCSPDGLPYIGCSATYKNLVFATGHAMMGLSLGPATGKLVAQLLAGNSTSLDVEPYHAERF